MGVTNRATNTDTHRKINQLIRTPTAKECEFGTVRNISGHPPLNLTETP